MSKNTCFSFMLTSAVTGHGCLGGNCSFARLPIFLSAPDGFGRSLLIAIASATGDGALTSRKIGSHGDAPFLLRLADKHMPLTTSIGELQLAALSGSSSPVDDKPTQQNYNERKKIKSLKDLRNRVFS